MLKRVEFTKFRGFRHFAADVAPVTAFLGPNSSGKTTALQAVRLACDAMRSALDSDTPARVETIDGEEWVVATSGTLIGDHLRLLTVQDWRALFVDHEVREGVKLTINLTFEATDAVQEILVEVACARNEQLKLDVRARAPGAVELVQGLPPRSANRNLRLTEFLRDHSPVAVFVPPFYGTVLSEELRSRANIDRMLGSGDQSHVVRNLVASLSADRFQRLNAFLAETLNAKLTFRTSGDALQAAPSLRVNFRDSNGEIELSAAGAGLVNLVSLYSALARWSDDADLKPVMYLLDEPEAHLHPRLQAESAARLARVVTEEFHAQLLLATHSVDILNRLSQEGACLLRCDRTATPSVVALDSDASLFDDLATWVDLTPYTAINFLASRRVLFVEGADELAILPRLGELRFRNDPTRLQRFRRWAIVELHGASNASISSLLARLVRNDVIRANAQSGGFVIEVALDRDYEREPGITTATNEGIKHTTLVWPVHSLESLMVTAPVLTRWMRAFLGELCPADAEARVHDAIELANQDTELNTAAIADLTTGLLSAKIRQGVAATADHGRAIQDASWAAQRSVGAEPAVWQRGKDRAAFVLKRLRAELDTRAGAHFPTDIVRLVERGNPNLIGEALPAIPPEVNALLERMAQP